MLLQKLNFHKILCRFFSTSHNFSSSDTIFALSSGHGKCGVAVIRVSGTHSENALKKLGNFSDIPKPRTAILRSIQNPITNEILDKGLILWFPGPRSFTGEDSFELHVHGGIAVVNSVLNALRSVPGLRLADPGEFTRRAFNNNKLDLTEVEGLADLLQAETEIQRKQAYLQTQGSLSKLYNKWKISLTKCLAHIEAHIDFEETDTLEEGLIKIVQLDVENLKNEIENHLRDGRKGEILRNGVKTVILGQPNVGKSSLLNLLCQRPAAIVTPIAGTTRDILEVTLNIGGYPLILADTAGLRSNTEDLIEKEGISRAVNLYEKSDLILLVIDCNEYVKWKHSNRDNKFEDYFRDYLNNLKLNNLFDKSNSPDWLTKECLIIMNKTDLASSDIMEFQNKDIVKMSCKTEDGVSNLVEKITGKLKTLCGEPSAEHPSMNQLRHKQHLSDCIDCLQSYLKETNNPNSNDLVLMAEHLRKALKQLGKLVGNVTTEQLLDVIFKDFCIGK